MKIGLSSFKSLLAKDNLKMTAGIVAANSLTALTFRNFGDKLPLFNNADGTANAPAQIAYAVLIPGLAGILVRRYDRSISDGLIIGGLTFATLAAINNYAPAATKTALGFSEYLGAGQSFRPLGAPINGPGGAMVFRNAGSVLGGGGSPFKNSNW